MPADAGPRTSRVHNLEVASHHGFSAGFHANFSHNASQPGFISQILRQNVSQPLLPLLNSEPTKRLRALAQNLFDPSNQLSPEEWKSLSQAYATSLRATLEKLRVAHRVVDNGSTIEVVLLTVAGAFSDALRLVRSYDGPGGPPQLVVDPVRILQRRRLTEEHSDVYVLSDRPRKQLVIDHTIFPLLWEGSDPLPMQYLANVLDYYREADDATVRKRPH